MFHFRYWGQSIINCVAIRHADILVTFDTSGLECTSGKDQIWYFEPEEDVFLLRPTSVHQVST